MGKKKMILDQLTKPVGDTSKLPKVKGTQTGALKKDLAAGKETEAR